MHKHIHTRTPSLYKIVISLFQLFGLTVNGLRTEVSCQKPNNNQMIERLFIRKSMIVSSRLSLITSGLAVDYAPSNPF